MSDDEDIVNLPPPRDDSEDQPSDTRRYSVNRSEENIVDSGALPKNVNPKEEEISAPSQAGDTDLIEKEWVVKAKQIVEQTGQNPHIQQQEIAKMKTEYIKKRYKRDIQL